ncbi:NLI interacting factor-like phosphatase-domain-containing protein [Zopfochytrium polystomum]|nr:NLI interacting factor-like phosphatase-domain-containing protein [Zopfochytrium polystomum]
MSSSSIRRSSVAGSGRTPLLLVLDLNGTLVDKVKKGDEIRFARANPLCPAPVKTIGKGKIYLRPYLDVFLDYVMSNFHVAVWTSATLKNAVEMTSLVCQSHLPRLEFSWNRSRCDLESRGYGSKKDLNRIWTDLDGVNRRALWSPKNTILIDDTTAKSSLNPNNHLLLPPFLVGNRSVSCRDDPCLLSIIAYLKKLKSATEACATAPASFDVREWLAANPLYVPTRSGNPPTAGDAWRLVRVDTPNPHETFFYQNMLPVDPTPEEHGMRERRTSQGVEKRLESIRSADNSNPNPNAGQPQPNGKDSFVGNGESDERGNRRANGGTANKRKSQKNRTLSAGEKVSAHDTMVVDGKQVAEANSSAQAETKDPHVDGERRRKKGLSKITSQNEMVDRAHVDGAVASSSDTAHPDEKSASGARSGARDSRVNEADEIGNGHAHAAGPSDRSARGKGSKKIQSHSGSKGLFAGSGMESAAIKGVDPCLSTPMKVQVRHYHNERLPRESQSSNASQIENADSVSAGRTAAKVKKMLSGETTNGTGESAPIDDTSVGPQLSTERGRKKEVGTSKSKAASARSIASSPRGGAGSLSQLRFKRSGFSF